jgi:CubicO group peptidase (beta-lactamase class C family)
MAKGALWRTIDGELEMTGRFDAVDDLLRRAITSGEIPGAVLAVGRGREILHETVLGAADIDRDGAVRPMRLDTLFDIASLTKVVATLPAVLGLVASGAVALDEPVASYCARFAAANKATITVRQLLTHTSGLPAHRELWRSHDDPASLLDAALAEPAEDPPSTVVRYSDLGFIALGAVASAASGLPLDRAARELVFEPLGMASTSYRPAGAAAATAAATEPFEDGKARVGVVHDENAAGLGGVAGHAGCFSNLVDLSCYLAAWADGAHELQALFGEGLRIEALRCQTGGLGGHRGLGWTARGDAYDHLGTGWPNRSVGHTGFTGTSLALDPESGTFVVLLTNAVRFGRTGVMVPLRRALHSAVAVATGLDAAS